MNTEASVDEKKPRVSRNATNLAFQLNGLQLGEKIPEKLLKQAREDNLIIVFAQNSYSVYAFGPKGWLSHYQNNGTLYLSESEFFTEPSCFEFSSCRWFASQAAKSRAVEFFRAAEVGRQEYTWHCQTDIPCVYFSLMLGKTVKSQGIVFHASELKAEYTDTELIDFLEILNQKKFYSGHVNLRKPKRNLGWKLSETRKEDGGFPTVREAIKAAIIEFGREF